jgi:hypothetical protein
VRSKKPAKTSSGIASWIDFFLLSWQSVEMDFFNFGIKMDKPRIKHYRWVVTGLIFFITLVNFVDRSAISFVIDPLKREFHFSDTQFGMILSAFGLGYVLLTAPDFDTYFCKQL